MKTKQSMNQTMNNETKKHVHAELIKAWAEGAQIQWFNSLLNKWEDCNPCWYKDTEYRIKHEDEENED